MEWPVEIVQAFEAGMAVRPQQGETQQTVIHHMLDQASRYAVWRAQGHPERFASGFTATYTPIGHLTATGVDGKADAVMLWPAFNTAVDMLYAHVRAHSHELFEAFRDRGLPFPPDANEENK